eukprot:GHVT01066073.1.p1 GENE.GHVT01066073.1~~GHVT01066073.1.p1  ORF type:complete len:113 (+),score=5.76 GHVT01066073.1:151-489(+)
MINSLRQKGFRGKLVYTRLHPVQLQLETSLSFVAFCLFAEASFNFSYFLVISSDKAHAALLPASSLDRPRFEHVNLLFRYFHLQRSTAGGGHTATLLTEELETIPKVNTLKK